MDGNMRRLPPWMIAGASSGVTATSNRIDDREVKQEAEAPKTKKKRKTRREIDDAEEEHKKLEIRRRGRVGRKIKEEEAKPSIRDDVKSPEIIQSVTSPEDEEDLTVDDLLSFAQEYVKSEEEDQALSTSESMVVDVNDGSNMKASQGETNGTRDPTSDDMISLLLGPFFNTRK
ncbi:hypothetical protein F2Q69_00031300 [Brassica cretica]|uniref:Uncharacterized protein n=1 Tax=Brassica cretica TaxID=69181 RepID=A0A8S9S399_BRACR|nr:hypothetical protein F2Q69_00031300 [Brassica cretica]